MPLFLIVSLTQSTHAREGIRITIISKIAFTDTMVDELTVCAAAFFRIKGKDIVAEKEFSMGISLDLRWMSVKEANALIKIMISSGVITLKDGYLRPAFDLSEIDVPMAYRPSANFVKKVLDMHRESEPVKKTQDSDNVFSEMISMAEKSGMRRAGYVAACNSLSRKLGVDIEVAGVMILRDIGSDVSELYEKVRNAVISK